MEFYSRTCVCVCARVRAHACGVLSWDGIKISMLLSVWLFNFIFTTCTLLYPGSWLRRCSLYVWRAWVERIWLIPDCKKQPLYSIPLGVVLSRRCSLLLCTLLVKFCREVYLLRGCRYFLPTMIFTMSTSLQAGQMFEMSSWVGTIWKHYGSYTRNIWLGSVTRRCTHSVYNPRRFGWRK